MQKYILYIEIASSASAGAGMTRR